ncbi:MAG TPA: hypothetical protein VIH90_07135 [Candidatus Saccharimonadales bacterium]
MTSNPKPTRKDKAWQQKIEKKIKAEKVVLDNPKGKERFEKTIKNAFKKLPK